MSPRFRKTHSLARRACIGAGGGREYKIEEANADRFRLAVEAFGTPQAYNSWIFATGLPDDIKLQLLYAGQGTLWTDMSKAGGNFGIRATLPLNNGAPPRKTTKK